MVEINPNTNINKLVSNKEKFNLYEADNSVLFIDELSQYPSKKLDFFSEILDGNYISHQELKPLDSIVIACSNPCPCGLLYEGSKYCKCTFGNITNFNRKLRGSFLERFDLRVELVHPEQGSLSKNLESNEDEELFIKDLQKKIRRAREKQLKRNYINGTYVLNGKIPANYLLACLKISKENLNLCHDLSIEFGLSARQFHQVLRIVRTIADLQDSDEISKQHILEAFQYKQRNKKSTANVIKFELENLL